MEKGKINLRLAKLDDVDAVLEIEKNLSDVKTYSALTEKNEITEEIKKGFFYLIKLNHNVVGDISYEMKDGGYAYISGLTVLPEFQGKGIARKAMEIILEKLKDVKLIDLVTHPKNERAIKLYESLGFKKNGEPMENYFGDGEPRIKMILEKY